MTLALLALLLFADPPQGQLRTFDAVSRQAEAARDADKTVDAIRLYREAVKLKPTWTEGWWYLGTLLYERDEFATGRDAFARHTKLDPTGGPAFGMLGLCEFQTKEYEKALTHLNQGLKLGLGPNPSLTHVARYHAAILLTHFREFEAAVQTFIVMSGDGIDDPKAVAAAGIAALRMPLLPSELPQQKQEIVFLVGRAVYDTGARRAADAKREWEEVVTRFPSEPNIHYLYGGFLLLSEPDHAIVEWKRELELSPDHVPARLQLAYEYLKRGDTANALPYAEQAVHLQPDSFVARNALGRVLVEAGDLKRGISELELAAKIAPQSPEIRIALATAYAKANRHEDAARERALFLNLKKEQAQ